MMKRYDKISLSLVVSTALLFAGISSCQIAVADAPPVDAQPAPIAPAPAAPPAVNNTPASATTPPPLPVSPPAAVAPPAAQAPPAAALPPLPPIAAPAVSTQPASPSVVSPAIVPSDNNNSVTDTLSINLAARDPRCLDPLLIPTDLGLQESIQAGRDFGKSSQDFVDLLAMSRRAFDFRRGGMFGEKRRQTAMAVWITPVAEARWRGFVEQREFASPSVRNTDFAALRHHVTSAQRKICFLVEIGDLAPAPKGNGTIVPIDPSLAAAVVKGTRFILSDDKDNNYDPLPDIAGPIFSVRQEFYDNIADSPDHILGDNPLTLLGSGTHGKNSAFVKRRPAYGDLAAFYVISFDAFNPDGRARVNRDTKSITLRVITSTEVHYAKFEINQIE